jgi:hypothetical protein
MSLVKFSLKITYGKVLREFYLVNPVSMVLYANANGEIQLSGSECSYCY